MEDFLEDVSAGAKMKLDEGGITELAELVSFSAADLQSLFNFTLKDLVLLKRHTTSGEKRKRLRDEEDDSDEEVPKNEARLVMAGMLPDPLGIKDLLPSRWAGLGAATMRSLFASGAWGRSENPHTRQEVDFLVGLALLLREEGGPCTNVHLAVWARLVQVALKITYPAQALDVSTAWTAAFVKLTKTDDLQLLRLATRVATELAGKSKQATSKFHERGYTKAVTAATPTTTTAKPFTAKPYNNNNNKQAFRK